MLEPLLSGGVAFGAWRGSRLVGFIAGTSHEGFGVVPAAGHAVDDRDVDTAGVYSGLYAQLADHWIGDGVLVHDVELPALQKIEDAWNDLGFGRRVCIGSRSTEVLPCDVAPRVGTTIRLADLDDLPSIVSLSALEVEFRAGPPMYLEGGPPDLGLLLETHAELFRLGAVHFVASVDGEVVGLLTLVRESRFAPICAEDAPFVSTTVTDPGSRRNGVGRMLVRVAADWAREQGHEHMDVSYLSTSPLGRPFWGQSGFAPVGWKVARRLPESLLERIDHATSRPRQLRVHEEGAR